MKAIVFAALLAATLTLSAQSPVTRGDLSAPTTIAGYPCAAGYAWRYNNGSLKSCTLAADAPYGRYLAPAGSWIELAPDGRPHYLVLPRDTAFGAVTCHGGSLLGGAEGYTNVLYPTGELRTCWLAADQDINGVPCRRATLFGGRDQAEFAISGALRSCTLSHDFHGTTAGLRYNVTP